MKINFYYSTNKNIHTIVKLIKTIYFFNNPEISRSPKTPYFDEFNFPDCKVTDS
jgi:hypothetical protein